MSPRFRLPIRPLAILLLGGGLATACSDASVEEARRTREAVETAATNYARLLPGGGLSNDGIAKLTNIADELEAAARDGDPGANLLLARVRLDLGRLRLDEAIEASSAIAARRREAMVTLAAADAFAASAAELRRVGFDAERGGLESARRTAENGIDRSRELLREIDDQSRIREIEMERLARSVKAAEERAAGYRELAARDDVIGAPEFLRLAADARATAGDFRVSIAEERGRLVRDANRTVRHTRAEGDLEAATAELEGSSRGLEALASIDASLRRQADTLAEAAATLRTPILDAAAPGAAEPVLAGERIEVDLDEARGEFDRAAAAAGRAASSGIRDARCSAQALELNARFGRIAVDMFDAERLLSEASLLDALDDRAAAAPRREEAKAAADRVSEELLAMRASLESFDGSGAVADMLRAELAASVDRLEGLEEAATRAAESPAAGSAGGVATATAAEPPFASVDELARFIASGAISNAPPAMQEQVLHASSRGGTRMLRVRLDLANTGDDVRVAMIETFGTAATSGPGGFGGLEGGTILSRGDGEAEFGTDDQSIRLVELDDRWAIDFDSLLASAGMADPAVLMQTAEMMEAASGQLGPFFRMFAQRIRSGEFGGPDEADMAMSQAIAGAMSQALMQDAGRR